MAEMDGKVRVFKFATDGIHLRALQREVTIFRVLQKALSTLPLWCNEIYSWNFEVEPFCIQSEYGGPDLLRWSTSACGVAEFSGGGMRSSGMTGPEKCS
jgi:hypothetical protein